jgi:ABC-type bacteriocin/lantibiotic exporter with double-glycine peptidase domain
MISKLLFLFNKKEKSQSFILIFLLFTTMIFELFGIAVLIPTVSLLIDVDYINSSPYLNTTNNYLLKYNIDIVIFFLTLLGLIFIAKSIIQIYATFKQKKIASELNMNISNRLFTGYLNQPFLYYSEKNRSRIIHNLQIEMLHFFLFFESFLGLIAESLITIGMYLFILYVEPIGTIILSITFLISSIIYFIIFNERLKRWGLIRISLDKKFSKLILESIGSIKNIILNDLSKKLTDYYQSENKVKAKYSSYHLTAGQLPRIYFELVAVFSIISFIMFLLYSGKDSGSLIITLTVFGAVAFKLLPSVNKIISNIQNIRYYRSALDNIFYETEELRKSIKTLNGEKDMLAFNSNIKIDNISFSFEKENQLLSNLNFKINRGDLIGVYGKSGKGKSTLINIITGLIKPQNGDILCDDVSIHHNIKSWQSIIGYVPQSVYLLDESILKNIVFENDQLNTNKLNDALYQSGLKDWIESLPKGLNTVVGDEGAKVSGGQKQRIGIASSLYKDSKILILDEPTSSLDLETENSIINNIVKLKGEKTIILISHKMSIIERCDRIIKL